MILNLHGLFGSAENLNHKILSKLYSGSEVCSRQIQYENRSPDSIMDELGSLEDISFVVGNSFGGFFAYVLSAKWGCPCLLVNPAMPATKYIKGLVPDYPDEFLNELTRLEDYARAIKVPQPVCDTFVILGKYDDVIDSGFTKNYMKNVELYEVDGGHQIPSKECKKLIKELTHKMEEIQ